MSLISSPARLSFGTRFGWAFGGAGTTTMLYLVNLLLLFFMVRQLDVPPAVAGGLLLIGRFYDGAADLLVGSFSDRTTSRWGRRRPWMAVGALVSALGCFAVFAPPAFANKTVTLVQIGLALWLFFTGYSMFAVPASAMPAEMTTDYDERTSLMSYRTFFLQVAGLVGAAGAPAMVAALGGGRFAYMMTGLAAAAFVGACMAVAVIATKSTRQTRHVPDKFTVRERLQSLAGNRPFVILLSVKFCGYIALASAGSATLFFMGDILHRGPTDFSRLNIVTALVGIAALPLWRWLATRFAKQHLYALGVLVYAVASVSWLMATPEEPLWAFYARAVLLGTGSTGSLLMALAMLPDTIELDFHRTGLRREGIYAAMFEFFQKLAYALGPFIVGVILQANGYVASSGQPIQQSPDAVHAVRFAMGVIPACAYALSLILLQFYRLPRR